MVEQMDLWTDEICEGDDGGRSGREEPFCRCPQINEWFRIVLARGFVSVMCSMTIMIRISMPMFYYHNDVCDYDYDYDYDYLRP